MRRAILLALLLSAPLPALTKLALAQPALVAELAETTVEITTGFTGASILVFGTTARPISATPATAPGDEILIVATGPVQPMVVRRKIRVLGFWLNGPSATFPNVPGYYAIVGTRAPWEMLAEPDRLERRLGLDTLPLRARGGQASPAFRAALLDLKQQEGLWAEQVAPVAVSGGQLFNARLPLPATVATGEYAVQVLLVRQSRVVARQELIFNVQRVGTAASINALARQQPALYGLLCIAIAAFAGWLGSVVFRRG
ncbi:uncharacterized protein (TIGR02186 family) [Humitalea rosea]|uniref:Uncharacterized protein (TIGR02186 family) n=1 Tax=Humitalea rosea TaxID=990373 RepID=A0A2W7I2V4_9PROT|nr:TIGR02186 family protein [Humitalea rosea]PZW41054.1 uncharacterized protein (TIGR02186 family) [Humitalea rosea]